LSTGTHSFADDPRNAAILIYVNGELVPRDGATVSVFDSGFILGDGVWEGLRLHNGRVVFLDDHLERLYAGARALDMDVGMSRQALTEAVYRTVEANGMRDGVHLRLMVTRGRKATPYQDPRVTVGPATVVIIPEYKTPGAEVQSAGIRLFTVHVRRGAPDVQDPKLNSHSKLNCILACIQAAKAGADEALMLDPQGFVATCNSTHFFIVRGGEVWTSTGDYCLDGITRRKVLELCRDNAIRLRRRGGFRDRHLCRRDAGGGSGRPGHRRRCARQDGRTDPRALPSAHRVGVRRRLTAEVRIAMWSGPRNISTAMMRAWENRGDTAVWDEPLRRGRKRLAPGGGSNSWAHTRR
jgi:branched-chain amino acid aminotransferase